MRVLLARQQLDEGLLGSQLRSQLPGWEIRSCGRDEIAASVDGVDVVCPFGAPVGADAVEAGRFGLVQQFGVGLDSVDVDAATRAGVWVARLPAHLTGNGESVAELAVLHLLALLRRLDDSRRDLDRGRWGQPIGRSLVDLPVLVVGLGATGGGVVERLRPFGPRITAVRAHPDRGGPPGVDRVVGPDALVDEVAEAEAIVCCAMLDAGSRHLFDARVFEAVKPGTVFVNVARGGLVDEDALLAALEDGRVAGAGLDVFATEPADPSGPLLRHRNVIATPHVAGVTSRMIERSCHLFAENLRRWESGVPPEWRVNEPPSPRGWPVEVAS